MADQLSGLSDSVEAIGQSIENPAMLPIIIRAARRLQPQLQIRALKSLNYHLLSKCVLVSFLFSFPFAFTPCQVWRSASPLQFVYSSPFLLPVSFHVLCLDFARIFLFHMQPQ
jgi:hypothetical protein